MKNLILLSSILRGLLKPLIRIYIRNNRLSVKVLCFIVVQVDYQVVRYVIKSFANARSKRLQ